jgi:hypothetical protein
MFKCAFSLGFLLLQTSLPTARLYAQGPSGSPMAELDLPRMDTPAQNSGTHGPSTSPIEREHLTVPAGTRLPLVLRNGINTRTAKPGDSVYFETIYPIAVNNRIAIPVGSFLRGQLLKSKRPGFVRGRGEIRMVLDQMTFPNGYTVLLAATPNSTDRNGQEGVDKEGTIKGPSGTGRDVGLLLIATGGGAYFGTLAGTLANGAVGTGALIGGGAGAAAAIIAILATRGPEAQLPRNTTLDVVFNRPLVLDAALVPADEPTRLPPSPSNRELNPAAERDDHHVRSPLQLLLPFLHF